MYLDGLNPCGSLASVCIFVIHLECLELNADFLRALFFMSTRQFQHQEMAFGGIAGCRHYDKDSASAMLSVDFFDEPLMEDAWQRAVTDSPEVISASQQITLASLD